LTGGNQSNPIAMIFSPKLPLAESFTGQITTWSGTTGAYYKDIDISALNATNVIQASWFDNGTGKEIRPAEVELLSAGDTVRVYMPNNTTVVNYLISVGGQGSGIVAGGGSGGVTAHNLLTNLSFAASGHTGFAPSPHSNTHHSQAYAVNPHSNSAHSDVYITAAGVTYNALVATSSVGTGSTQVARGNHTHQADIPSNEIILFEKDTAVVGYTLLTTFDDGLVYITKGSVAGSDDIGGTSKTDGTWTQPNHTHSIATHTHTASNVTGTISTRHYHGVGTTGIGFDATGGGTQYLTSYEGSETQALADGAATISGSGTLTTGNGATDISWRPKGRNFTRQRRI